ncbi:MAG: hypothetical protein ABIP54_05075, partial [Candidatus Andersenbacteria bacterium]
QQKPSLANPGQKATTASPKKPALPVPASAGAKPNEKKSLADAVVSKRPVQRVRRYPSLAVLQELGRAYENTIEAKLDALAPEFADDVVVIKSSFNQLQKTRDVKEADTLIVQLNQLLTGVSSLKEKSTLDEASVSSVARALRSLKALE